MSTIPVDAELLQRILDGHASDTPSIHDEICQLLASPQDSAGAVAGQHVVSTAWLKQIHRDLDACQKLIWANLRGCDPAYYNDAQARLAEIDAMLEATPQSAGQAVDALAFEQHLTAEGWCPNVAKQVAAELIAWNIAGPAVEVAGEREAMDAAFHSSGLTKFKDTYAAGWEAGAAWRRTQSAGVLECSYCQGHGEVTRQTGQTPEQYECWNEVCPDCAGTGSAAPQPAQQPNPDVARLIRDEFPLFDEDGLSETEHHCEWNILQERKRLHALLDAALAQTSGE